MATLLPPVATPVQLTVALYENCLHPLPTPPVEAATEDVEDEDVDLPPAEFD